MNKRLVMALLGAAVFTVNGMAQNELWHYDGTTDFTSRGTSGVDIKTLMQRIPGDQACGATEVAEHVFLVQDQNGTSPETLTFEIRVNDATVTGGAPDMSALGLLATTGPLPIVFPCPAAICAIQLTLTWGTPIVLPAISGTPAGDFYVGLNFPASPLFPADGISLHASGTSGANLGEQMNAAAVGYSPAPVGNAGMGWQWDGTTLLPPTLGSANRAWRITTRFVDDVTQPFADNPTTFTGVNSGLNPNFGYAGIWPDTTRSNATTDKIGVRVRTTNPPGTLVLLLYGLTSGAPTSIPGVDGRLCILPPYRTTPTVKTVAGGPDQPISTSAALFGPSPVPPVFIGLNLFIQGVSFGAVPRFATMCRVNVAN